MAWTLVPTGFLVGRLLGATGMGGGSLMTPIVVLLFGYQPALAVGTDIAHGAVFKTFGALRHRRLGTVNAPLSGWMLIGSAPASLVGVALATWLKHRYGVDTGMAQAVLGAAFVLGGLGVVAKVLMRAGETTPAHLRLTRRDRVTAVAIGVIGGFVVGLTSIGTGVFFGLSILIAFRLRSADIVGTDLFHAAALLWVARAAHAFAGNVSRTTVGWLLIGSTPGVLLGSQTSIRVSGRAQRMLLGLTLTALGAVMCGWIVASVTAASLGLAYGVFVLVRPMCAVAPRTRAYEEVGG